jgi:HAD superfamily hydrolase (TIGR01662 family)
MLKAVLFDFGNTLVSTNINWAKIVPRSLEDLRAALSAVPGLNGERLGRDFLFIRHLAREEGKKSLYELPATEALKRAVRLQGIELDPEKLQQAIDAFFAAEEKAYPLIFGIPEVLYQLRELGLKMAVVSNATCGRLIRRALESRKLLGLFDQVTVSAEVGLRKPHPQIFKHTAERLGCLPSACAMVGDQPDTDIEGAKACGMFTVLARFLPGPKPAITADAVVTHPARLKEVIYRWL